MVLIIAGGTTAAFMLRGSVNADALRAWVASLGVWAPVGFVVIYTFGAIALVPGGVFDLAGGALFGPYLGSVLDLIGGTLGAAGSFLVARYLVRDWVEIRAGPRMQRIMQSVDEDGWQFVAFLRLVPIFPYTLVNYVLGPHAHPVPPLRDRHHGVHGALDRRLYLDRLRQPRIDRRRHQHRPLCLDRAGAARAVVFPAAVFQEI